MNPWIIYLVMKADMLCVAMGAIGVISLVISLLAIITKYDNLPDKDGRFFGEDERRYKLASWWMKRAFCLAVLFIPLAGLMPNTKTLAAMYIVPKVFESKVVKEDVPELYDLALEAVKRSLVSNKSE